MRAASVQFSNITVDLRGATRLHGLTHTLSGTGITALVGSNGAGKSLLLKVLHGLIPITRGQVRWAKDLAGERRALMRQQPDFLRRSAQENLVFALEINGWKSNQARVRSEEMLDWMQLEQSANLMANTLSPGERSRLAMARALAIEPAVLLLDEPTASLDPESALAMESVISFVQDRGTKVILVSHSLGQVRRLASDVLMLDQGQSIFFGPTDKFFSNPGNPRASAFLHGAGFSLDEAV